jgi:hypothetical protein
MHRIIAVAALTAALAGAGTFVAACGSTSSITTGTEHVTANVSGKNATANSTKFNLTYTGPVDTTGTFITTGNGPVKGQQAVFTTKAGKLDLVVTSVKNSQSTISTSKCEIGMTVTVGYTVYGKRSTGSWRDASGTGTVVVKFSGDMPKLKTGACNMSNNAAPITSTARGTWTQTGKFTVHS